MRSSAALLILPIGLGLLVVLGLLVAGARHREEAAAQLDFIGQDNTVLHAATSLFEIERFRDAVLQDIGRREDDPPGDDVRARFDILWNNISVARSGDLGRRFERVDRDGVLAETERLLERHAPRIDAWNPSDRAGALAMLAEFGKLAARFRGLMTDADREEQALLFASYDSLVAQRRIGNIAAGVAAGVSLLVGLGAFVLLRRERRRAAQLVSHARAARAAAESRARFLTMVSHELRTPMNGVLGLLDVLRAGDLTDRQASLAAHASVSAQEMLLVIEALLLLSDVRDGRCALAVEDTSAFAVARETERRLAPFGAAGRPPPRVTVAAGTPFRGDAPRLAQALGYLLHYVGGAMGSQDGSCAIGPAPGGGLQIRIGLGPLEGLRWGLETVFAEEGSRSGEIAADAIGPAAARELLLLMGAGLELGEGADGLPEVRITAPSVAADQAPAAAPLAA